MAKTQTNGKTEYADVSEQIETLRADIEGLNSMIAVLAEEKREELKDSAKRRATKAKAHAADAADELKERASEAGKSARREAEAAFSTAEDVVRRQPAMALGVAAGVGFLVGLVTSRRL